MTDDGKGCRMTDDGKSGVMNNGKRCSMTDDGKGCGMINDGNSGSGRDSSLCYQCAAPLNWDDQGIYRKMVSRNAREFLCMDCLAAALGCRRLDLEERVQYYRESGNCTLFR